MAEQRVQRRLAAILAADMVGYSRLMEADEEETAARQKSCRAEFIDPKIADHHGRIVNTTGRLLTALNLLPSIATQALVNRSLQRLRD